MKARTTSQSIDFAQIGGIVGALRGVVISYLRQEFAEKFPYLDEAKHGNLCDFLSQLLDETTIRASLGKYKKQTTVQAQVKSVKGLARTVGSYIYATEAPLKIWRLEHIDYFTRKAEFVAQVLNHLSADTKQRAADVGSLCAELTELKNSVQLLKGTRNDRALQVTINGKSQPVQGMLGSNNASELISRIDEQLAMFDCDAIIMRLQREQYRLTEICAESGQSSNKSRRAPSPTQPLSALVKKPAGKRDAPDVAPKKPVLPATSQEDPHQSAQSFQPSDDGHVSASSSPVTRPLSPLGQHSVFASGEAQPVPSAQQASAGQRAIVAKAVNEHDVYDDEGYTPLHRAIMARDVAEVSRILAEGAGVGVVAEKLGYSPLLQAILAAKATANDSIHDIVAVLLENGAGVNETAALYQKSTDNQPAIRCNLLHLMLFNESSKGPQWRNLVKRPNASVIQLLLEAGIDTKALPETDPADKRCKDLVWYVDNLESETCKNKKAHLSIVAQLRGHQQALAL